MSASQTQAVTNRDLYDGKGRTDDLCVVTARPVQREGEIVVTIEMNRAAAVVQEFGSPHAQPYSVRQIHEGIAGQDDLWLLSGGALVLDRSGRIAVGLRDGNAADPYMLTNIGAGRCNRRLADHCEEEFQSEFILCIRGPEGWVQVQFGEHTPDIFGLRKWLPPVRRFMEEVGCPCMSTRAPPLDDARSCRGTAQVIVNWSDSGRLVERESLRGYAHVDEKNHTLEFRLPMRIALSAGDDARTKIFFAEGTGIGMWMHPAMVFAAEDIEPRRPAVTPLLAAIAEMFR